MALCIAQIPARQRVGGGFVRTPGVLTGTRDRLVVPPIIDWHARALSLQRDGSRVTRQRQMYESAI